MLMFRIHIETSVLRQNLVGTGIAEVEGWRNGPVEDLHCGCARAIPWITGEPWMSKAGSG
jgi:hypothetical protein